jgi:hypothetical protein
VTFDAVEDDILYRFVFDSSIQSDNCWIISLRETLANKFLDGTNGLVNNDIHKNAQYKMTVSIK